MGIHLQFKWQVSFWHEKKKKKKKEINLLSFENKIYLFFELKEEIRYCTYDINGWSPIISTGSNNVYFKSIVFKSL